MIAELRSRIADSAPFFARVICSSHLPSWRPEQDYRRSYSASREMGGGVLVDLIHEPDYCHLLFGPIGAVEGTAAKVSGLGIETEDTADMMLSHKSGMRTQVHLDYFGLRTQRKIEVFGDGLYVEADLILRTLIWIENGRKRTKTFAALHRDDTYRAELKTFFRCLDRGTTPMNNLQEHLQVLRPILAFRRKQGWERIRT
jgi:predicted dehydrogenase